MPISINARKNTHKHIIFKLQKMKDKQKVLKEGKGKEHLAYKGTKIKIIPNFSPETHKQEEIELQCLKC